ncbi:major capsid protein [Leptotrichia sp. HSP-342]|uniref:Major capsid protein n=1 Tax=Leptotrichia mesophila TaxID=3239303 RepID=A0AB39VBH5_9FUSO
MSMNLTDLLNAKSLNKYYAGVKGTTLVEAMFPAVFSNTFDINTFGSLDGGAVEVLQSSQLDADVMFRDWDLKTTTKGDKQFFREGMKLDEKRRKELLEILNTNNQSIIDNYSIQIFEKFAGAKGFLGSARAIAAYTVSQFLSTAKVTFVDENGGGQTINYRLANKYKETLAGTNIWSAATAKPLEDLERWKEIVEKGGGNVEIALMSKATYNALKKHDTVKALFKNTIVTVTPALIKSTIEDVIGMTILIWDEKIKVGKTTKNVFPDNIVTLIPNGQLGVMEYGPTPTKTDELLGLLGDREVVDIAGTFATVEVVPESKSAGVVNNVNVVIEDLVAPNPSIMNSMFIATVG